MITTKRIAELAGVSRGTVDRVINNRGGVSKKTKENVLRIINETKYVPNKAGQVLASQKLNITIGVILPSINNFSFDEVKKGIRDAEKYFMGYGIKIVLIELKGFNHTEQLKAIDDLVEQNISGLILVPINVKEVKEKLEYLNSINISVVTLNSDIEYDKKLCHIGIDFNKNGTLIAGLIRLIINKSAANILIITGSKQVKGHNMRIDSFCNSIKPYPQYKVKNILECLEDDFTAFKLVCDTLQNDNSINVIYVTASGIKGVCKAVEHMNMQNKINVFCYDFNKSVKEYMNKDIIKASVVQDLHAISYKAVEILSNFLIYGTLPKEKNIVCQTSIKIKENI